MRSPAVVGEPKRAGERGPACACARYSASGALNALASSAGGLRGKLGV